MCMGNVVLNEILYLLLGTSCSLLRGLRGVCQVPAVRAWGLVPCQSCGPLFLCHPLAIDNSPCWLCLSSMLGSHLHNLLSQHWMHTDAASVGHSRCKGFREYKSPLSCAHSLMSHRPKKSCHRTQASIYQYLDGSALMLTAVAVMNRQTDRQTDMRT